MSLPEELRVCIPGSHEVVAGEQDKGEATALGEEILLNVALVTIIVRLPNVCTRGGEDDVAHGRSEAGQNACVGDLAAGGVDVDQLILRQVDISMDKTPIAGRLSFLHRPEGLVKEPLEGVLVENWSAAIP